MSIWERKPQGVKEHALFKESDCRDNDTTRLPSNEAVHLGGLVFTEAYTPATVSMLYTALKKLPMDHNRKQEWLTALANFLAATTLRVIHEPR